MSQKNSTFSLHKSQLSYLFFILGIILLIIPELNGLNFLPSEIRSFFTVFFYPGLLCVIIGFLLK
jgi:hypothetical protein